MFRKTHPSRIAFHVVNTIVLGLMALICLYPFWYILIYSLSDATQAQSGVTFWFKGFSLNNFAKVMQLNGIGSALFISVARTLSGTSISGGVPAIPPSSRRGPCKGGNELISPLV